MSGKAVGNPEAALRSERSALSLLVAAQTLAAGIVLPSLAFFMNRGRAEEPWAFASWPVYMVLVAAVAALGAAVWGRGKVRQAPTRQQRSPFVILATALAEMPGILGFTAAFIGLDGNLLGVTLGALASLAAGGILFMAVLALGRAEKTSGPITLGR